MAFVRKNYSKKTGKLISIFIQVYGGNNGKYEEANKKSITIKIPDGLSSRSIEKFIKEQELIFEKKCCHGFTPDAKCTFKQYADEVLETKEAQGLKKSTLDRYKELLIRINDAIGNKRIDEILPAHLNQFYKDLAKPGQNKKTGKGLSSKTILEHHRLISTIMDAAFKEMKIDFNPAERANPPRPEKHAPNYFQLDQLNKIKECADQEDIHRKLLIYLFMITGGRRGEVLGLKWQNYDKATGLIYVDSNILKGKNDNSTLSVYETTPKTETSTRYIKLPQTVISLLEEYRLWQESEKEKWGDSWIESPYILTASMGGTALSRYSK